MSIRFFLIFLIVLCLAGGYCLDQIQLLWNSQYQKKSENRYVVDLHYRDIINFKKNLSQFIVAVDLAYSTENTYLVIGASNSGKNLFEELEAFFDRWSTCFIRSSRSFLINEADPPANRIFFISIPFVSDQSVKKSIEPELISAIDKNVGLLLTSINKINQLLDAASENGVGSASEIDLVDQNISFLYEKSEVLVHQMKVVNEYYNDDLSLHEKKIFDIKVISWLVFLAILSAAWYWADHSMVGPINRLARNSKSFKVGERFLGIASHFKEVSELSRNFTSLANRLIEQALEDTLTGLNNRRSFDQTMSAIFTSKSYLKGGYALCFIDVDDFKLINDTYGHQVGDKALLHLAKQLKTSVRSTDFVARIGGDEFAILLIDYSSHSVEALLERIRTCVCGSKLKSGKEDISLSISIGAIRLNHSIKSAKQAIVAANHACKFSKESGKNNVKVLNSDDPRLFREHKVLTDLKCLKEIIHSGGVDIFVQKIVSLSAGKAVDLIPLPRYEVLSRFKIDKRTMLNQFDLITLAENYGLASELDTLILSKVFDFLRAHPSSVRVFDTLHINLSASSLGCHRLKDFILNQLDSLPFPAKKITFEITETAAMKDRTIAIDFIEAIRDQGVTFALDDFGAGMCSFAYLKDLPVDVVKIDGKFISNMDVIPSDYAIVEAINDVAQSLGKKTVGEYVENEELSKLLMALGVNYAQGFYYHKPEPIEKVLLTSSSHHSSKVKLKTV